MKIIYIYNKNFYAAIKAAYIHLKLNLPEEEDIQSMNGRYSKEGHFFYLGLDEDQNEIYLLYSSKNSYILENLLHGFAQIYDEEILVINEENKKNRKDDGE